MFNDPNADTEFNDALRAHGILPPKPPTPKEPDIDLPTHSDILHAVASTSTSNQLADYADDALDSDDERLFLQYREKKLQEAKEHEKKVMSVQGGTTKDGMREIGRDEFVREVTEGSKKELEGEEGEGKGTGVVCFLYQNHIPASNHLRKLLSTLLPHHPLTRFLSIRADACIANYPDKNVPTLLLYRNGECLMQMVAPPNSLQWSVKDLEARLVHFGVIDGPSASLRKALEKYEDERDEEEEDEEDEWGTIERGKKGQGRGIRTGGTGLGLGNKSGGGRRKDDDDDSDFDM